MGCVIFRGWKSLRPPFLAYPCSSSHCKEDKEEPARTQVAGHGNAPKPGCAYFCPQESRGKNRGMEKEGAIICVGADGSNRIKYTRMDVCVGTTFPSTSQVRQSRWICSVCPFSRQKETAVV